MSALLRVMVITLAFLACNLGHLLPGAHGFDNKADAAKYMGCPPCPGETGIPGSGNYVNNGLYQVPGYCKCPRNRIPERRNPGFGQNGNYGSHGDRFRPGIGSYGQGFPGVAIPIN